MSTLGAIFAETESDFCYVTLDIPIRPTERYIISEYEINFTWGELVQSVGPLHARWSCVLAINLES